MLFKGQAKRKFKNSSPGYYLNDPAFLTLFNPNNYVNAHQALINSDLFSVISRLASDVATSKFRSSMLQTQYLLDNPDPTTNGHSFWQSIAAQLLLDGNAFAYIWRNSNGHPIRFEYLRPNQVTIAKQNDGMALLYQVNFDEPKIGFAKNVPQGNMLHFRLMSLDGGKIGRSPLLSLQDELAIKKSSNSLTMNALGGAISSNGILRVKGGNLLTNDEKIDLGNSFMSQVGGGHGPVVLDDLTDYSPLEINADVSKLLSSTDWVAKQITKVYKISDTFVNGKGDQQSSSDMADKAYIKALNSNYIVPIISELDNKLAADITVDISSATDPTGDQYVARINTLTTSKALAPNQAIFALQEKGYLPKDLPKAEVVATDPPQKGANE
ncbi:phage portal protein [Oenococcus sp.]|uniref:phage portal protein n=1 Tax=Oenococcus sp. TaxID=1979414 RepID=UPI0039E7502E